MSTLLNGIYNFLSFINDNWTMITVVIGLSILVGKKVKSYINMSQQEKIDIAKAQIREIMLRLVTEAEIDYQEWVKAGSIKRSQVIDKIFEMFPILSIISDQEEIISWIDEVIDLALNEMRKIIEENKSGTAT